LKSRSTVQRVFAEINDRFPGSSTAAQTGNIQHRLVLAAWHISCGQTIRAKEVHRQENIQIHIWRGSVARQMCCPRYFHDNCLTIFVERHQFPSITFHRVTVVQETLTKSFQLSFGDQKVASLVQSSISVTTHARGGGLWGFRHPAEC